MGGLLGEGDHLVGEVNQVFGRFGMPELGKGLSNDVLEITLPLVDHVVDPAGGPKNRVDRVILLLGRGGDPMSSVELPVVELLGEKSELPEVVGNVFTHVGDGSVGFDDHLLPVLTIFEDLHDPAALVGPFGPVGDNAALLEKLEGALPEAKADDVALPGKDIVADSQACHRLEVTTKNTEGNGLGVIPFRREPLFHTPVDLPTPITALLVIPLVDLHVEIPEVIVGPLQLRDLFQGEVSQLQEPIDDVGHLNPRIVDVILDLHVPPLGPEHPHQGVSQDGVAEMTDVGRLVGVDVGMFDNNLHLGLIVGLLLEETLLKEEIPMEEKVDVSGTGDLHLLQEGEPLKPLYEEGRNFPRIPFMPLPQLKG